MKRNFSALQNRQFDLLICGGGIYGAWTAYDAALRGLKVAIVEQGDWAGATSSASSKLIHGGLRYLESYDFKLVKKALAERQMLLQAAPHRVWPLRFGVPVYAESRIGRLQLKMGLMLYDFLAASPLKKMAHQYFNRQKFSAHFPLLDTTGLKGGFTYSDAQTDDARFVLELIAGAMEAGAVCVNYCKLLAVNESGGHATGGMVQDVTNGQSIEVHAKQTVFATGQWLSVERDSEKWCRVTRGVHLVMPGAKLEEALLLTARTDGRVFFIIPWYGRIVLGTTDTDFKGDINAVTPEDSDVSYLLDAANHYLKTAWKKSDVINSYAGLRVMKRSDKASPSAVSRDWELKTGTNGVHYSIGGKITSAREDATCIVDQVCAQLGMDTSCASRGHMFPWAPMQEFATWCAEIEKQASKYNVDVASTKWLIRRHGKRAVEVLKMIEQDPSLAARITPAVPIVYADLLFCTSNEMVVRLDDLLRRRLPLLILAKLNEAELTHLARKISGNLHWDEATIQMEVATCLKYAA